jgi:tetratricopeptide (TPR) repeat protein
MKMMIRSIGVVEKWSDGSGEDPNTPVLQFSSTPVPQYSSTPALHFSTSKSGGIMRTVAKLVLTLTLILSCLAALSCGSPEEKKMKFFNKGKALYEKGDYMRARLEFKNAVQIDSKYADGYYMLGMTELQQKNWKRALGALSKAVELDPDHMDGQVALGRLFLAAGEKEKALEKVELVLSKQPQNSEGLLLKAQILLADQKTKEAETILASLIRDNPSKPDPYLVLSRSLLNRDNFAGAIETLKALIANDGQHKMAHLFLAEVLEKKGDLPEAEKEYRTLIAQNADDHGLKLLLANFYLRSKRNQEAEQVLKEVVAAAPKKEAYRLALAQFYEQTGQGDAFVSTLNQAIEDLPDKFGAYETLARHQYQKRDFAQATGLMDRFMEKVKTGPELLRAKLLKAEILFRDKKDDDALSLVNQVLEENRGDIKAHGLKGDILANRKDYAGAIAEYRAVLGEDPQNIPASLSLARAHLLNDEPLLAEQAYKKILEQAPDTAQARYGLIDVYKKKGRADLADEELRKIEAADPNNPVALSRLTEAALSKGDLKKAEQHANRLREVMPDSPVASYQSGLVKLAQKDPQGANAFFEAALAKDANFVPALSQIVSILVQGKKVDSAVERCKKQLAKAPDNPGYHLVMGRLLGLKGDKDGAHASFEKALSLDPNSQEALFRLAQSEQVSGNLDLAIEKYEKVRKGNPKNLGIGVLIATLYEKKGEPVKAKAIYEDILSKDPNVDVAANNLAFFLAEYDPTPQNLARAQKLIDPLLDRHKGVPQVVDTGAWVYYRLGKFDKARELLATIEKDRLEVPAISYHSGMVHLKLGDKAKAKEYLQTAVKSEEDFPGKDEAVKTLKDLG